MTRRRPVPPIIALQEPPTYVIDSCAWFDIRELADPEAAWSVILKLIERERVCLPQEVVEEIRDDEIWERLHPYETKLKAQSEERHLLLAGLIASQHPQLARIRSRKTRADPFVIALAEIERFTVVTDENEKRPSRKIAPVCAKRKVECLTLVQMLEKEKDL